jgi:uncharacterized membrane protein (UPF0127 family)
MTITNLSNGITILNIRLCQTFWTKFQGLMGHPILSLNEGILLRNKNDSVLDASIHMFFMRGAIAAIWINKTGQVVDKTIALPWHPYYAPRMPASDILEVSPEYIDKFNIRDEIQYA